MASKDDISADTLEGIITKNRILLVESLDCLNSVLDKLYQERFIVLDDMERIKAGVTRGDKVRNLLEKLHLMRHKKGVGRCFLRCLMDNQEGLFNEVVKDPFLTDSIREGEAKILQKKLRDAWEKKKLLLTKHPWFTERSWKLPAYLYTQLKLIGRDDSDYLRRQFPHYSAYQHYCRDHLEELSLKKLFNPDHHGMHVLLEGDPGIGKTTLCYKLLYDFCDTDVDDSKRYFVHDLLFIFLVEVRNFHQSLRKTIQVSLRLNDEDIGKIWDMVQQEPHRCLFILDGLDEVTREFPEEVQKIMEGSFLPESLVLATCRTNQANVFADNFHQEVINVGFIPEQSFEFVSKYLSQERFISYNIESGKVMSFIEEQANILGDLLRTPLNCLLLCLWLEELLTSGREHHLLSSNRMTTTGFYEMVVNSSLKRYCKKENIPLTRGAIPSEIKKSITKLYRLALYGVLTETYKFNIDDCISVGILEDDAVLNMGFLAREYSVSVLGDGDDIGYSFPHRSLQDFFAAKAIEQLPQPIRPTVLSYFAMQSEVQDHIILLIFGVLEDEKLLKWLLCCLFQKNYVTFLSEGDPHLASSKVTRSQIHVFYNRDVKRHRTMDDHIEKAFQMVQRLRENVSDVLQGNEIALTKCSISEETVSLCILGYRPPGWIWLRNQTGKLKDALTLCLRALYEIASPEKLAVMTGYLLQLSDDRGPDWDVVDECSAEILFVIVKLWSHPRYEGSVFSSRIYRLVVPSESSLVRSITLKMLFDLPNLQILDLQLTYYNQASLADLLETLGPRQSHIERMCIISDSRDALKDGLNAATEVKLRGRVRVALTEMKNLRNIQLFCRSVHECLDILPVRVKLKELTILASDWPHEPTEHLLHQAIATGTARLILQKRSSFSKQDMTHVLQSLMDIVPTSDSSSISDVHLQGFQLHMSEKLKLAQIEALFASRQITMHTKECTVIMPRVTTIDELTESLNISSSRSSLTVSEVLHVDDAVYEDTVGCLTLVATHKSMAWVRLGPSVLKIVMRILEAALQTSQPLMVAYDSYDFERYMLNALAKLQVEFVELTAGGSEGFQTSIQRMKSLRDTIESQGGQVGFDHGDKRVFISFTGDPCKKNPSLSKTPFGKP